MVQVFNLRDVVVVELEFGEAGQAEEVVDFDNVAVAEEERVDFAERELPALLLERFLQALAVRVALAVELAARGRVGFRAWVA